MINNETDKYVKELLKYLIENNLYEEVQKKTYIKKVVTNVKKSILYLGDSVITYDKYIEIDGQMILAAQNVEEFTIEQVENHQILEKPITEQDFCIYLFLNKEFLKTLLDLFSIKNDIQIPYNDYNLVKQKKIS